MSFADQILALLGNIDKALSRYPALNKLENDTGVKKSYVAVGFASLYLLLIFANIAGYAHFSLSLSDSIGQLLANVATLVVPGYFSLQALETKTTSDDTHYLTYWVVYAAFSILEFWSATIVYWMPFYWFFKTILFFYLGLPQFNGARIVYTSLLRPFSQSCLGIKTASPTLKEKVAEASASATSTSASVRSETAPGFQIH